MKDATNSIAGLATRYRLDSEAAARLELLTEALAAPEAPTTVREPGRIRDDHLADTLVALELPELDGARRIADLGAGAGIPGLVLAIARPEARVTLVESNARKCGFITATARALGLINAAAAHARAEEWVDGLGNCELVTARALAPLPVVAEYAAPLLVEGGALVAWRGRIDPAEEQAAAVAAVELGLDYRPPQHVRPYPWAVHRHLQVLTKVAPTPPRFPRRPGIARKRPLGRASDRGQR